MNEVEIYQWVERMSKHRDNFLVALTYYTTEKAMIPRSEEKLKNEENNLFQHFRILKADIEWLEKNIFLRKKWREEVSISLIGVGK